VEPTGLRPPGLHHTSQTRLTTAAEPQEAET